GAAGDRLSEGADPGLGLDQQHRSPRHASGRQPRFSHIAEIPQITLSLRPFLWYETPRNGATISAEVARHSLATGGDHADAETHGPCYQEPQNTGRGSGHILGWLPAGLRNSD